MKKLILFLSIIYHISANSQVGIGTINPERDLHIAGANSTIRIDGLNEANNVNNDGSDTKVFVNSAGRLILYPSSTDVPVYLVGNAFLNTPTEINQTGYSASTIFSTLASGNFNLAYTKTVKCSFSVGVSNIRNSSSVNNLNDGKSRIVSVYLFIDGVQVSRASYSYTSSSSSSRNGIITLSSNCFRNLTAGNHTWELRGGVFGFGEAFRASFGGNPTLGTDFLQIIDYK